MKALSSSVKRIALFGSVGVVCTLIDFLIYAASISAHLLPIVANTLAFFGANIFGYIANGKVTFKAQAKLGLSLIGYGKYCAAYFTTFLVSTAIVVLLVPHMGAYPAKGVAILVTVCANYLLASKLVFRGD